MDNRNSTKFIITFVRNSPKNIYYRNHGHARKPNHSVIVRSSTWALVAWSSDLPIIAIDWIGFNSL